MEKRKRSDNVAMKKFLNVHIGQMALLNNIVRRKANWVDRILIRNYLLHNAIKGQMTELKGVERKQNTGP